MKDLRRLIPYFSPYRWQVLAGLLLVVVSTAITSVIPWLLRRGIDAMGKAAPFPVVWGVAATILGTAVVAGVILLDSVDIRDLPLAELRREIGLVQRESVLFSDTIGSNVGCGADDPESLVESIEKADSDTLANGADAD